MVKYNKPKYRRQKLSLKNKNPYNIDAEIQIHYILNEIKTTEKKCSKELSTNIEKLKSYN